MQLLAVGIYTLRLKSLLKIIDRIFEEMTTGYKPVTRADLNIFVQTNLCWVTKEMFVSRKRKYTTHSKEIGSKYRLQTLYIGESPFKLRLYDKLEELKNSPKRELMYAYFQEHGMSSDEDIFNIEFEMHRKYLRTFSIDSVDELLSRAEMLFESAMSAIKMVDLSTISEKSVNGSNRYKALTHPLWNYLSSSYELTEFLATDAPLIKVKRKKYAFTVEEAIKEHIVLARRVSSKDVIVDEQFYSEVLISLGKVGYTNFKGLYSQNKGQANESAVEGLKV